MPLFNGFGLPITLSALLVRVTMDNHELSAEEKRLREIKEKVRGVLSQSLSVVDGLCCASVLLTAVMARQIQHASHNIEQLMHAQQLLVSWVVQAGVLL